MIEIKVFTNPESVCYTFVFVSVLSVFGGYVVTEPQMETIWKVVGLLGTFGLLIVLILTCKLISRVSIIIDKFFDRRYK